MLCLLQAGKRVVIPGGGMRKRGLARGDPDDERGDVVLILKLDDSAPKFSKEQIETIQRMADEAMKK